MAPVAYDREQSFADREKLPKRATNPEEQDKIATANQLSSPILRLPGEIRTTIYTYVCFSTIIKHGEFTDSSDEGRSFNQTFLFTCNQFYCEAVKLMYSLATFELSGWPTLKSLNSKYRQFITSVQVDAKVALKAAAMVGEDKVKKELGGYDPERCLPGVKKLYVRGKFWTCGVYSRGALRAFFKNKDLYITGDKPKTWAEMLAKGY
ncbi:hypothetical protein G6011_02950 [Alternaria panax]|uniref:Uncharacterized protein n=1 Tax=Alternaria panax TaxID=48097 RepID=A0AAD4FF43_9PLEO|nr:hypothetical protein G6011_02950 [Alternaria panax]